MGYCDTPTQTLMHIIIIYRGVLPFFTVTRRVHLLKGADPVNESGKDCGSLRYHITDMLPFAMREIQMKD